MKKSANKKRGMKKPKPELKWQTGKYARHANFQFILPYEFLLLCRLWDKSPERVIYEFMVNAGSNSLQHEGNEASKLHLWNYFTAQGYGQQYYSEAEMRDMFKELQALSIVFPWKGDNKMVDLYAKWRDKHLHYWFKQWHQKIRRNPTSPVSS